MKRTVNLMKLRYRIVLILTSVLAIITLLSMRKVPPASSDNCAVIEDRILEVKRGMGASDVVLTLEHDDSYYYINRGLERGLDLSALRTKLTNRNVTLHYVRHWTPLAGNHTRHVARVELEDGVVFNEIKTP